MVLEEKAGYAGPSAARRRRASGLFRDKYLMQFEGHAHTRCHDSIQQVHVSKHPFISGRRDAEIPLEKGVKAVEKRLQAAAQINHRS